MKAEGIFCLDVGSKVRAAPHRQSVALNPGRAGRGAQDTDQSLQDSSLWAGYQMPCEPPAPLPPSNLGQRPAEVPGSWSLAPMASAGWHWGLGGGQAEPPEFNFLMFLPNTFC